MAAEFGFGFNIEEKKGFLLPEKLVHYIAIHRNAACTQAFTLKADMKRFSKAEHNLYRMVPVRFCVGNRPGVERQALRKNQGCFGRLGQVAPVARIKVQLPVNIPEQPRSSLNRPGFFLPAHAPIRARRVSQRSLAVAFRCV